MPVDADTFALLDATVARFVAERLIPAEDAVEDDDEVPAALVDEMRDLGLFGLSIPEEHGGLGLSLEQEARLMLRMGGTALAFRSVFGTNVGIGSQGILMDGTAEQKARFLPRIASGEAIISFALTEPEAGSDAASLATTARRDGDHYVLNGTKRYITNAPRAQLFTVMARSEPGVAGANGISAFVVDADTPGIRLGKPDRKMGQRGTRTCDVVFEDARVPADRIIGGVPGRGFRTAMKVLDRGRIHISAVATGLARRMLEEAARYAVQRRQFGRPIAEFQLVQAMLADSRAEIYAAECMALDAARRHDSGDASVRTLAACCKLFATEMAGRVADRAVQVHGGAGYMNEYKVERFYRDVRLLRLYEGTTQIQQLIIGRAVAEAAAG
jgi:acyl-CoA dehydrogenase